MQKVIFAGKVGRPPELRITPGGTQVLDLSVAHTEVWNDAAGQRQTLTIWTTWTLWGMTAENAAKYLVKGQHVTLEGKMDRAEPDCWIDKSSGEPRSRWKYRCTSIEYGPKPREDSGGEPTPESESQEQQGFY